MAGALLPIGSRGALGGAAHPVASQSAARAAAKSAAAVRLKLLIWVWAWVIGKKYPIIAGSRPALIDHGNVSAILRASAWIASKRITAPRTLVVCEGCVLKKFSAEPNLSGVEIDPIGRGNHGRIK